MTKTFTPPNQTAAWKKLLTHQKKIKQTTLKKLFQDSKKPNRFKDFSIEKEGIFLDYSKNLLTKETIQLLISLAKEMNLEKATQQYFAGGKINWTEDRSVLHTLLRNSKAKQFTLDGENVLSPIRKVLAKMEIFSKRVRSGQHTGATGKKITDVVNIGIGGSYLGPKMTARALWKFSDGPKIHFISNVDANDMEFALKNLSPETTLFLIASKTFTTEETLTNAHLARKWIVNKLGVKAVEKHFACMSTNAPKVEEFGINLNNMFEFWDFVGGRYSIWSAIGLPLMIAIGPRLFREFLKGGEEMDHHFKTSSWENNLPVLLALIGIWHNNFLNSASHLVVPYYSDLAYFPSYLQQMDMESNGKTINQLGKRVSYTTGNILWGEVGTDAQHSFYQLLHQGTKISTIDFIGVCKPGHRVTLSHNRLMANLFAQSESFAFGFNRQETIQLIKDENKDKVLSNIQLPHRIFEGNRSSNTILIDRLTPNSLGKLIALYEHKVFVQGVIWGINSFDQWGVELGKRVAKSISNTIQKNNLKNLSDSLSNSSTSGLVDYYLKRNKK